MKPVRRSLAVTSLIALSVIVGSVARADDGDGQDKGPNQYVITPLTADLPNVAPNMDPILRNAWGVAFSPGASPFWIADNASGCSTLYDGQGLPQPQPTPLKVKIPLPGNVVPSTACRPAAPPTNPPAPTPAAPTGLG